MKRMMSKLIAIALTLVVVISGLYLSPVTASAKSTKGVVKVTQVTATPSSEKLLIGGTQNITTSVKPSNATNKKVTYTSSNTAVAVVSKEGQIKAVGAGQATITVAADNSKKSDKVTVTVYKDIVLTNKDVKSGVATLKAGTYGNITISNTVDTAKVIINKAVVKGTLTLEGGAAYTVEATRSSIKNVSVVTASAVTAQAVTGSAFTPSFSAGTGAIISRISVSAPVSIIRTVGRINVVSVEPQASQTLPVGLSGFNGSLEINGAANSNITIETANSKIKTATIDGGVDNQLIKLTSLAGDTSSIKTVDVAGTVNLVVNVPATTVAIADKADNSTLTIDRPVAKLTNAGDSSAITVNSTIASVTSTGTKAKLEVSVNAIITSVIASGDETKVSGAGKVTDVKVEGNKIDVATVGTKVAVDKDATGTVVAGKAVEGGTSTSATPTPTPTTAPVVVVPTATPTPTVQNFTLTSPASKVVITFSNNKVVTVDEAKWFSLLTTREVGKKDTIDGVTATLKSATIDTLVIEVTSTVGVEGTYTLKVTKTGADYSFTVTYPSTSTGIKTVTK